MYWYWNVAVHHIFQSKRKGNFFYLTWTLLVMWLNLVNLKRVFRWFLSMYQYSLLNYSFLDGNYIIQIKHQEKDQNSFTWLFPYIDVLCFAVLELWWSCEPDSMLDRDHRHWIYFVILMIIMICIFPISWNVHRDFFWMHRNARIVMIFCTKND